MALNIPATSGGDPLDVLAANLDTIADSIAHVPESWHFVLQQIVATTQEAATENGVDYSDPAQARAAALVANVFLFCTVATDLPPVSLALQAAACAHVVCGRFLPEQAGETSTEWPGV